MTRASVFNGLWLILVAPLCGAAAPVSPNQQQLTALLAGNSMTGIWAGRHYSQYFSTDGATRYREQNGPVSEGRWRVDKQGRYCSQWPPSDRWDCYEVLVSGANLYWKSAGEYYPAEIHPGNQFDP